MNVPLQLPQGTSSSSSSAASLRLASPALNNNDHPDDNNNNSNSTSNNKRTKYDSPKSTTNTFEEERKRFTSLPSKFRSDCFNHLTAANLANLESQLLVDNNNDNVSAEEARAAVIGAALLRRIVHSTLSKKRMKTNMHVNSESAVSKQERESFENILNSHVLPDAFLTKLSSRYSDANSVPAVISPPTWLGLLRHFQKQSAGSRDKLWGLVQSAPWLDYVPVQCSSCGTVIPDETNPNSIDEDVGLKEVPPTAEEHPHVRAGWYRGPRSSIVFQIVCKKCGHVSRWYRSSEASTMLTPEKWGRLCGEQEDLRAWFAYHLEVPLRRIMPLDWDHVWSEYKGEDGHWMAPFDPSARNFAVRLEEGIGFWSGIVAVGDDVASCECVTEEYLTAVHSLNNDKDGGGGGRADLEFAPKMKEYRHLVQQARLDSTGRLCQARTVNGHILERAKFTDEHMTFILQRAVSDFGTKHWWEVGDDDVVPRLE